MPPQSRGNGNAIPASKPLPKPANFQSKSIPNLPTLRSFQTNATANNDYTEQASPEIITSPSEPASIEEDFSLDSTNEPPSLSDSASDSEDDDNPISSLPTRPLSHHHHSRSYNHLAPQAFAPPFYGRPPTPLPPSPSLTSLLRPTFSSNFNSRPTTPDPSSDEGGTPKTGTQTPNSAAASTLYRTAKQPIARASPKVPTYEYYGFTLYLTSSLVFIVYILWSFLPSPVLHQLGIYYYPNRWWALAMPAWTVMLVCYIYIALASYNTGYLTLPMKSVECLVDEAANVAVVDSKGELLHDGTPSWQREEKGKAGGKKHKKKGGGRSRQGSVATDPGAIELDWRTMWNEGTDAVMDIPIGGVCEILYGRYDDSDDDDDMNNETYDK
jgi:phosphatidylinositol N-acetylglucosaminyltransferase subunit P